VSEKYSFIDAEKAHYPIVKMCAWLQVSTSGFYTWRDRPASPTARRRARLAVLVQAIFDDSDGTYGYRRIHAALRRQGEDCGPELVRDLMRELDLVACQPRAWRPTTTQPGEGGQSIPDLVGRDFTADAPGTKLVGSGSRREFHPPAPTEPCVIVSHYTAPAILVTRSCGTNASERTSTGIVG
jgi:putative transposase